MASKDKYQQHLLTTYNYTLWPQELCELLRALDGSGVWTEDARRRLYYISYIMIYCINHITLTHMLELNSYCIILVSSPQSLSSLNVVEHCHMGSEEATGERGCGRPLGAACPQTSLARRARAHILHACTCARICAGTSYAYKYVG